MSSRLADDLAGLVIDVGAFAGLEAIEGVEANLDFATALVATGAAVLPLAPTVLHAPPEAYLKAK